MIFGKEKTKKHDTMKIDTVIGHDVCLEGTLTSKETLRIDGRVKGRIECEGSLLIGSDGKVEAEVIADNVYIAGELRGNITANNYLEINESGKVYGDITTAKLVVDQGVLFEGKCHMISKNETEESVDSLSLPSSIETSYSPTTC
ncbi:MAG: polymer-forming cytoskeletal protein [Desulfatiglans sp.]|jgi:cytoskeletal protein CcmA (bactofilin family)|nr:polymer-forming cytoskeletal protein [Thermodesulfobacteriota bacterium]MEE4353242.1 polymer-forming cytoskeletal protein [Desulfatiglans sp.]